MKRFAAKTIADYEAAKQYVSYDPKTGLFVWIKQTSDKTVIGKVAGSLTDDGYIEIIILGCRYRAHRLAWYISYGSLPPDEIDHKDTIKDHNWLDNLRASSRNHNMCNKNKQKNNTSGYKGVSWSKVAGKWTAQVQWHKVRYRIGYFDCPKEAYLAYCDKAKELHTDFANLG